MLIVEGLIPDADIQIATRLNIAMISSLSADIIPVLWVREEGRGEPDRQDGDSGRTIWRRRASSDRRRADQLLQFRRRSRPRRGRQLRTRRGNRSRAGTGVDPEPAGAVGAARDRCRDAGFGFDIFNRGDIETARVEKVLVGASNCGKLLGRLRPGTLVVTSFDRSDAIVAAALIAQRGMPLAGFVLTCGSQPMPDMAAILAAPPLNRLPVLIDQRRHLYDRDAVVGNVEAYQRRRSRPGWSA